MAVVKALRPLSALVTIIAAVGLGGRLRRVDDASNISHDIRLVGGFLLGVIGKKMLSFGWIVENVFFGVSNRVIS